MAFFCFSCIFLPNVAILQFFVTCQAFFANFCVTLTLFFGKLQQTKNLPKLLCVVLFSLLWQWGAIESSLVWCFLLFLHFLVQCCHLAIFCNLSGVFRKFCLTFCRREDDVFAVFQVRYFFDVSALNSAESVLCRVRNVSVNSCKIRHSIKTKHIRQTNGKQIALTGKMAKNAEKNVPKGEK